MKRILPLAILVLLASRAATWSQEAPPLALEVEFEWTLIGTLTGAGLGAALWLTDPANPNLTLAQQVVDGASWGTIAGFFFGIYILQRAVQAPQRLAHGAPTWAGAAGPARVRPAWAMPRASAGVSSALAQRPGAVVLPVLTLRF